MGLRGKEAGIFIAGHTGLVGGALLLKLRSFGYSNLITRTHSELNLEDQFSVRDFFQTHRPEVVVMCAAKVGGIAANSASPVEFFNRNMRMTMNVCEAAQRYDVERLFYLSSSCAYPKNSPLPIAETQLLKGELEATNEAYALAKSAGMKLCDYYRKQYEKDFISLIPCNLYGVGDNYDLENSHVIPGMIMRILEAKRDHLGQVKLWGSGKPLREFLHADDLADAIAFLLEAQNVPPAINIGSSSELSICELANLIARTLKFEGEILWDQSRPDGVFSKVLDSSIIRDMGWRPKISLEDGLKKICTEVVSKLGWAA